MHLRQYDMIYHLMIADLSDIKDVQFAILSEFADINIRKREETTTSKMDLECHQLDMPIVIAFSLSFSNIVLSFFLTNIST